MKIGLISERPPLTSPSRLSGGKSIPGFQSKGRLTRRQWFEDQASGKDMNRPAFLRLQNAIAQGQVDTVVIYKLDRLSRSMMDGLRTIVGWLEQGVRLVSVSQQFDFSGAMGKMLAAVLLGVAEMERELILERQAAGIALAKERGAYEACGRPAGPSDMASILRARELMRNGATQSEAAGAVGLSARTLRRWTEKVSEESAPVSAEKPLGIDSCKPDE